MSQLKTVTATKGKALRTNADGSNKQGCGNSRHFYVGRDTTGTDRIYHSLVRFPLAKGDSTWTNVGNVISASLILYTHWDSVMPTPSAADTPRIRVKLLTDDWAEGNNADGVYDTTGDDEDDAAGSTASTYIVQKSMNKAQEGLNTIDVTELVKKARTQTTHYGFGLFASSNASSAYQWSGASEDNTDAALRPSLEITYEYGTTTPEANDGPVGLTPDGAVATLTSFDGDYLDIDTTDQLSASEVEVYTAALAGTSATNDLITTASPHGYVAGSRVMFTTLTAGDALVVGTLYYVLASGLTASAFKVSTTAAGTAVNITDGHSALVVQRRIYTEKHPALPAEQLANVFSHVPGPSLPTLARNTNYQWRARVYDSEALYSAWTALTTFSVTNTAPNTPTLTPLADRDTLDGALFIASYTDADNDAIGGYQFQLSYDVTFADPDQMLWDTGFVASTVGAVDARSAYSGQSLWIDTFHWRARVYDALGAASDWSSVDSFALTADFEGSAGQQPASAFRKQVPWRIVIKEMAYSIVGGATTGVAATDVVTTTTDHGLTIGEPFRFVYLTGGTGALDNHDYYVATVPTSKTFTATGLNFSTNITDALIMRVTTRGPGNTVAVLEDAMAVGATIMYNSPGEMHFTLHKDHPQIGVIEPRRTHYSVQFYSGDGWKETFAGLIFDYDANEDDVIFYGIDYLGLLDYVVDERYSNDIEISEPTGSKYVNKKVGYIVRSQLERARTLSNSPVGFITTAQSNGTMEAMFDSSVTIYSTYAKTLDFITGLLDSEKAGLNIMPRLVCRPDGSGGYEWFFSKDAPTERDNLTLRYGELVQGYRIVPFGSNWATRANFIGRARNGKAVLYQSATAPGIVEAYWGRWMVPDFIDGVADENDLQKRARSAAIHNAHFGRNIGLGVRSGTLQPRDGYDVTNAMKVLVNDGVVNTDNYGSGYWVCLGIAWEAKDQQEQVTTLTLVPRDDSDFGTNDLTESSPINPQNEWMIGWEPPDPLTAFSLYFLDQTTGIVWVRDPDAETYSALESPGGVTNPGPPQIPADLASSPSVFIDADGHVIVRMLVTWTLP